MDHTNQENNTSYNVGQYDQIYMPVIVQTWAVDDSSKPVFSSQNKMSSAVIDYPVQGNIACEWNSINSRI